MVLVQGELYEFKHGKEPLLMYIGDEYGWHQFTKAITGRWGKVHSELHPTDLELIQHVPVKRLEHRG
jgi:hypothetical protein